MNKYTVVYVAHGRYDSVLDEPRTRVEYVQGNTLEEAIDAHIEHMKGWAIHDIIGEVVYLDGHVKQHDIGHGIGHAMGRTHTDVIITGINNSKIKFDKNREEILTKHLEETQEDDPHIACFSYPNCDEAPLGCIAVMGSDVEPYGNKD